MKFVQIENGVVQSVSLSPQEGFVAAPDDVIAGQVLQSDGNYANPAPSPAVEKESRRAEIILELSSLDLASIRPLRAGEGDRLAEIDRQAQLLREELAGL